MEGTGSKLGFHNDLFEGAASIRRIVCPAENAFNYYHAILETTLDKAKGMDFLVLIALGPTATVLAHDLAEHGVQSIDVGHIDIEYEWFQMKATSKVPVPWRYVNEQEIVFLNYLPTRNIPVKLLLKSAFHDSRFSASCFHHHSFV